MMLSIFFQDLVQLLVILTAVLVATVLDFLQTVSVNQTVLISETAVMISTARAVSALFDA